MQSFESKIVFIEKIEIDCIGIQKSLEDFQASEPLLSELVDCKKYLADRCLNSCVKFVNLPPNDLIMIQDLVQVTKLKQKHLV